METPDAGQNIITRGLPKTGQVTQYRAGDDGQYEAGWWRGRLNANNRERWISESIFGEVVVIDKATGLMWAADGNDSGCFGGFAVDWDTAIDGAEGLTFATFTDWRLPNVFELASILRLEGAAPFIEQPPFSNTVSAYYWTSTTYPIMPPTVAYRVSFSNGYLSAALKTDSCYVRAVRKGL